MKRKTELDHIFPPVPASAPMSEHWSRMAKIRAYKIKHGMLPPSGGRAPSGTIGHIYFIACPTHIKIGFTADPLKRLAQLRSPHYRGVIYPACVIRDQLIIVASLTGTEKEEKELQRRLRLFCDCGEWFHLTSELIDAVTKILEINPCMHHALGLLSECKENR